MDRRSFIAITAVCVLGTTAKLTGFADTVLATVKQPHAFDVELIPPSKSPIPLHLRTVPEERTKVIFTVGPGGGERQAREVYNGYPFYSQEGGSLPGSDWVYDMMVDGEIGYDDTGTLNRCFAEAERLYELTT